MNWGWWRVAGEPGDYKCGTRGCGMGGMTINEMREARGEGERIKRVEKKMGNEVEAGKVEKE